jgi:hypothetical protein
VRVTEAGMGRHCAQRGPGAACTAQQPAEDRIQSHRAGPRHPAGKLMRDPGMPIPLLKPVASVLSLVAELPV